jgi:hypothetical protein
VILLDAFGRVDFIEQKWPRAFRFITGRSVLLVLILFAIALLAEDWRERQKEYVVTPLIVKVLPPAPPVIRYVQPAVSDWKWEPVPREGFTNSKPGVTALITAQTEMSNLAFDIKCSIPCKFEPQSSQVSGVFSGLWPEELPAPGGKPNVVRVRIRVPALLRPGEQLSLYFSSLDDKELSLDWVRLISK